MASLTSDKTSLYQHEGREIIMLFRTAIFSILVPTCLFAESYGTLEGCAQLAGTATGEEVAVLWDRGAGEIKFRETTCVLRDVTQVGSGGVNVGGPCRNGTETWDAWFLITSTADDNRYILTPEEVPREFELQLCE